MSGPLPRLIAITDLEQLEVSLLVARVEGLLRSATPGSVAVLLRDHQASARERLSLGEKLRSLTLETQQELWVADRLDLALLLHADGIHLGEGSVPTRAARRLLGEGIHLSRAWHRPEIFDTDMAELEGVDALLLSPIIEPRKGRPALGMAALTSLVAALRARAHQPVVYALGGVTADNAGPCLAAGAHGIAAIGAALQVDPTPLLEALQTRCVVSSAT